jgi:serine/threonine protein kinase
MAQFASGTRIGRYQVVNLLGSGGMGDVYLVREEATDWYWALKTLRAGGPDSEIWKRFMNEGRVHSELHHPNIAAFREMFLYAERPCLIMEYVDGETLFARIQRMGRLPVEESLEILNEVCDALSHLHGRNIFHRDLKSANVKVNSAGRVKLLDFGIAKYHRAAGMTMVGAVMGTPEYLAPELILGHPASVLSEVWTIGLLAYEMLTGRLPFIEAEDAALYEAIRSRNPEPPSRYNSQVTAAVDGLVMRCLDKKPGHRFQSPAHLRKAIAKTLGKSPGVPLSGEIGKTAEAIGKAAQNAAAQFSGLPKPMRLWSGAAMAAVLLLFILWMTGGISDSQSITLDVVGGAADVYENGSRVGRTPYRMNAKTGDSVQVELRRSGYMDQPVQFDVTERKVYSYTMQRANSSQ